jgi:hypothetical protein
MSDLNLLNPSSIKGRTRNIVIPSTFGIAGNVVRNIELLSNPASSGKLLKINEFSIHYPGVGAEVIIDNLSTNAFKVNIDVNNTGSPTNSAPTDTKFIFDTYDVNNTKNPPGRWIVIDKNHSLYLQEGQTLRYNRICFAIGQYTGSTDITSYVTISYEEIS